MVHIQNNTLIIEITCGCNEKPLARLSTLQEALIDLFALLDYKESPRHLLQNSTDNLSKLLKDMVLTPEQGESIMPILNNSK